MNSLLEIAAIFFRLGATAFGGPLAHIALMRSEFVDKRKWLTEQEFLDLNGAVNLIPGPNSTELAMHIGHKRAGNTGLWVAGICFIVPAMVIVLILAELYRRYGTLPASEAILWGVSPAVVAIIVQALWKFAPTALKSRLTQILAGASLILAVFGFSEVGLILLTGLVGLIVAKIRPPSSIQPHAFLVTAPLGTALIPATAMGLFWTFLKMGCVVYGSGYVLLAYLRSELVENLGWISDKTLLDAIAVGQVTPGPVFTTATFLGYQIAGLSGAIAATLGIFGPSFLFVGLLASILNKYAGHPKARIFLDCVNATSFALMAFVTFQLARNTVLPAGKFDGLAALLLVFSTFILLKTRLNSAILLIQLSVFGLLMKH
jgi:chromate transporter